MRIREVADQAIQPDTEKLLGLIDFLAGRAEDTNSRREISQDALISLAQSLGINLTRLNLPELTTQQPLSRVLEPLTPNSDDPVIYKGGASEVTAMPVNRAQDIVAQAAKSALKRRE